MTWIFDQQETTTAEGASIKWIDQRFFTLEFEGTQFHGEILSDLSEEHQLLLKINHRVFHIRKKHALDELIHQLGMDKPKIRKIKVVNAPMPGRIVKLLVSIGDCVDAGTPLVSLEAMKMENTLKSSGTGTVKTIHVCAGSVVEKGALLFEFE
ncbi:MAG: acetyl-CoA carboxylase biotin carboxyl carrier protein subunit [Bacteroidetes bacterium]|nr:acetyl-CoA carboxylase biotin carboxyl carrier protein subunit [Bacteroidota bacterium]